MPDSIQPIGAMIKPPDPQQSLGTLSGIYGIKQQQQALQTGQYTQASAQAESQQAQQKNTELQKAQAIAINGAKSGQYDDGEGGIDRQKMANDILKVAPVYGQGQISALLSQANEVVANKQAHQNLTLSQKKEMGDTFASLAGDPQVDNTKFIDAVEKLRQAHRNDPDFSRMLTSMTTHYPGTASAQQQQSILGRWSAAATGEPQAGASTVDTGTQIQPGQTNKFTGAFTPAGQPINKQSVVTTPAGPLAVATPGKGTVAPLTTAGGGQELNPTAAQQAVNVGSAQGLTGRIQQAQAAANNTVQAQDALSRARVILDEPSAPNTGAGFQKVQGLKNLMSTLGIDTQGATDANSLVKNLARYEASRATQAGLGGTDAARELAHNGSPNVSIDNGALKGIVTQSLATEKALAAYANAQTKTKDAGTLAKNEADFRNIPNLIQGYEYGLARSPSEAEEFLKKHGLSRADMAKTRQLIKEFEHR
jgi:hypothetical protein